MTWWDRSTTITVDPPSEVQKLRVGMRLDFFLVPAWYVRLWRWFRALVGWPYKEPEPARATIVQVDHETRTVTLDHTVPAGHSYRVRP